MSRKAAIPLMVILSGCSISYTSGPNMIMSTKGNHVPKSCPAKYETNDPSDSFKKFSFNLNSTGIDDPDKLRNYAQNAMWLLRGMNPGEAEATCCRVVANIRSQYAKAPKGSAKARAIVGIDRKVNQYCGKYVGDR